MITDKELKLVLASTSPRRRELLSSMGHQFEIVPSAVDEAALPSAPTPWEWVKAAALAKAQEVADRTDPDALVIGSDTIVVIDGRILGKPTDPQDAARMLASLAGQKHEVCTGVALIRKGTGQSIVEADRTHVWMAAMAPEEIATYIATGEPMDKAGAYAIQGIGSLFVERIEGCYTNVVGLPLPLLSRLLHAHFGLARIYLKA